MLNHKKKSLGNANSCKQNLQRLQLIKGASAGIAGVVNLARPGQDGQGTSHQKTGFFLVSTCSTQTAKAAKTVDTTFCPPGPAPSPSLLSSCFCSGGLSRTRAPWPLQHEKICFLRLNFNAFAMRKRPSRHTLSEREFLALHAAEGPQAILCQHQSHALQGSISAGGEKSKPTSPTKRSLPLGQWQESADKLTA